MYDIKFIKSCMLPYTAQKFIKNVVLLCFTFIKITLLNVTLAN